MTNATRNIAPMPTKRRPRIHMILLETPEGVDFCKGAYPTGRLMLARRLAVPIDGWRVYGEVVEMEDGYRASIPVYGLRTFRPPYTIEVNGYTYALAWVYTEEVTVKATAQNG